MAAILNLRNKVDTQLKTYLGEENRPLHGKTGETAVLILQSIFANIAIQGTSEQTEFLSENVEVRDAAGTVIQTYNLREVVNMIKMFRAASTDGSINSMTFRQVCEAFAPEARDGLVRLKFLGVFTNLYATMPEVGKKHPELMFDFCRGLNMLIMDNSRRAVITNMNRRLLQTEFAKSENEAKLSAVTGDLCI
nr:coat protein [cherry latent virus 1]WIF15453.1 coat protein [cherry latent virus 1]